MTCQAFDPDLDDVISYIIKNGSYVASDNSLESIVHNYPFELDSASGELFLNFSVLASVKGFFEFKVEALDLGMFEELVIILNF